jgi:hypothetical protein
MRCAFRGHPRGAWRRRRRRCMFALRAGIRVAPRGAGVAGVCLPFAGIRVTPRGAGVAPVRGGTYFSLQRQRKVGKRKPLTPPTLDRYPRAPDIPDLLAPTFLFVWAANASARASPLQPPASRRALPDPPALGGKLCVGRRAAWDTMASKIGRFRLNPWGKTTYTPFAARRRCNFRRDWPKYGCATWVRRQASTLATHKSEDDTVRSMGTRRARGKASSGSV